MITPTIIAGTSESLFPSWFGTAVGVAFPFIFVGMWLFISSMLARMGWVHFAAAYGCETRPIGTSHKVPFACFGGHGARYNGVVRAVVTESGLYLYNFILFRAFHHPFVLPWSSIERAEPYSLLWSRGYTLYIQDSVGTFQMKIRDSLAAEIQQHAPHILKTDTQLPSSVA